MRPNPLEIDKILAPYMQHDRCIAYRFVKRKRLEEVLSNLYVSPSSNRWNSLGTSALYASLLASTATLEMLRAVDEEILESVFGLQRLLLPTSSIYFLPDEDYPSDWFASPHPRSTQLIGDKFLDSLDHLAMIVRSVASNSEYNLVINPRHQSISQIIVEVVTPWPHK